MDIWGNKSTFNLEQVLLLNIKNSDYYNDVSERLESWTNVVDEIYYSVEHAEPWMSGNARGPSTAFCLLYKFFTMGITYKQIKGLLDHGDSPYIRCIGFLYLRYVCDPNKLWQWFEPYLEDSEQFSPSPSGPQISMGTYILDILLSQFYFETIFPRIPERIRREIIEKLRAKGLPTEAKGNAGTGGKDRRGTDEPYRRPASVKSALSVAFGQRAPNRSQGREAGRGFDHSRKDWGRDRSSGGGSKNGDRTRDYDRRPSNKRYRSRSPAGRGRKRSRSRSHSRDKHKSWHRKSSESPNRYGSGRKRYDSRERGREKGRYHHAYDRRRSYSREKYTSRDRSRSRSPYRYRR